MLYRFRLELSDVDRGVYTSLDFRVALHPSEAPPYLLSRVLAYALNYQEGLEFTPQGLGDPDAPALWRLGLHNSIDLWIEIGNPSSKKLHKAGKTAKQVMVYTYKSADVLMEQIKSSDIYRSAEIQVYAFDTNFLLQLEKNLEKNNRWAVLHQQGHLDIDANGLSVYTDVRRFS